MFRKLFSGLAGVGAAGYVGVQTAASSKAGAVADEEAGSSAIRSPNELFFTQLLEQRIVILHGRIDDKQSTTIIGQLLYLELKDSSKPIKMMINSGGGAVHSALAIHDVMNQINSPVYTSCYGHAESAAAILLSSGEKGHRCASASSRVMIHQPARNENGKVTASNAVNRAAELDRLNTQLASIVSDNSDADLDSILVKFKTDTYMTAAEALELGLIDQICQVGSALMPDPKPPKVSKSKSKSNEKKATTEAVNETRAGESASAEEDKA